MEIELQKSLGWGAVNKKKMISSSKRLNNNLFAFVLLHAITVYPHSILSSFCKRLGWKRVTFKDHPVDFTG